MEDNVLIPHLAPVPATLFTPSPKAAKRRLEFFTVPINRHYIREA